MVFEFVKRIDSKKFSKVYFFSMLITKESIDLEYYLFSQNKIMLQFKHTILYIFIICKSEGKKDMTVFERHIYMKFLNFSILALDFSNTTLIQP